MENEYFRYDATALSEWVKTGQIHPAELLEAAIQRVEAVNPRINAIIHTFYDKARHRAKGDVPKGPFEGVPFLLKDLGDNYEGEPICMGSRGIRIVSEENSELVNRFLAAGVVPFGKTNTPEFGLTITTEPKSSGPCHNPWRQGISTGGSSGGSAAAVAAGMVPMASANDGGGSIRFPSACCGLFGLKPSRGLNPLGPEVGEGWDGAVAGHVLTRSVRDSAAMLDATAGPEVGSPYLVVPSPEGYLSATQKDPEPLRIAFSRKPFMEATLHPEAIKGLETTAKRLEELGHYVEEADPAIDTNTFWRHFFVVVSAHTAAVCQWAKQEMGPDAVRKMEPATQNAAMIGRSLSACDLAIAKAGWHEIQLAMGRFLTTYDLLLTPALIGPPDALGVLCPTPMEELAMKISRPFGGGKWLL
ncbi:MAG: amidase, partial [Desulfobacterales bacterium]|nr:amidase [Desulfobacterales bacterium]